MPKDGFYNRITIASNTDLNIFHKDSGIYSVALSTEQIPSVSNFPEGIYGYGVLLVFKCNATTAFQLYIPHSSTSAMCYRGTFDNAASWSKWVKLYGKTV